MGKSNNYVHVEVLAENYNSLYIVAMPYREALRYFYVGGYWTRDSISTVLTIPGSFIVWRHPEIATVERRIAALELSVGL